MSSQPASATAAPAAAPATTAPATEERGTAMVGKDVSTETVPGGNLMIASYIIVWVIVLLFIVRVFQRQNEVGKKLAELESDLSKRGARPER
ncbi:MAG: hypothetical protein HYV09_37800 [Deltaproteobacteria bacterium]|nr:hypothetical protein [Deltaproteobacteria bacterium]